MFDGAQVASTIKVPLLPPAPAFLSESSSSLESVSFGNLSEGICGTAKVCKGNRDPDSRDGSEFLGYNSCDSGS